MRLRKRDVTFRLRMQTSIRSSKLFWARRRTKLYHQWNCDLFALWNRGRQIVHSFGFKESPEHVGDGFHVVFAGDPVIVHFLGCVSIRYFLNKRRFGRDDDHCHLESVPNQSIVTRREDLVICVPYSCLERLLAVILWVIPYIRLFSHVPHHLIHEVQKPY